MKTIIFLLLAFLQFSICLSQEDPTTWVHRLDYMYVEPGMEGEYMELEKTWKKIHKYYKDQDIIDEWQLVQVMVSDQAQKEYQYVTRLSFRDSKRFDAGIEAYSNFDNLSKILTPEEIKIVNKTGAVRRNVKTELWKGVDAVFERNEEIPSYHVYNFFKIPETSSLSKHQKVEQNIWLPIHKMAMAEDLLEGWVLVDLALPYGSDLAYTSLTVDVYNNLSQYFDRGDAYMDHFKKVHPDKDPQALMDETDQAARLIRSEVRKVLMGVY